MALSQTSLQFVRAVLAGAASLLLCAASLPLSGCAGNRATQSVESFASPEAGAEAMTAALRANDTARVKRILGEGSDEVLQSGDEVADRNRVQTYLDAYATKHAIVKDADGSATITVGQGDWPLPIPLVERNGSWHFDMDRGKDEILSRRIGRNELSAIEVCRAIADAQQDYFSLTARDGGVGVYAAKFLSDPGTHNGLYWPVAAGETASPLGELVGDAAEEGYKGREEGSTGPHPYHGYCYRMLTAQGEDAPGGAMDYMSSGRMSGGFAAIAYPVEYGNSGVMTFMVGRNGIVYQRDLGAKTADTAHAMKVFSPGLEWAVVLERPHPTGEAAAHGS